MHAVFEEDYSHNDPLQVQFGPCDPCVGGDLQRTVYISIIDDNNLEFDQSFNVEIDGTMIQPAGLSVLSSQISVLIRDDGMTVPIHNNSYIIINWSINIILL